MFKYDVIVIGGGHAGVEAVNIISKMKKKVLLITKDIEDIGELNCNPSMGGIGKSHLIRETDALGGVIGYLSTKCSKQLKKINISKGEAVNCVRSQIFRKKYKTFTKKILKKRNINIIKDIAEKIIIKNDKIEGVKTINNKYKSKSVIITVGTFLKDKIYIGKKKYKNKNYKNNIEKLSEQLRFILKNYGRLKTGTPPRVSYENIELKNLELQRGDNNPIPTLSSWFKLKKIKNEKFCWITKTTTKTKDLIKKNLKKSPIYNNLINGTSPRYCPAIEDKFYKFYKKKKHNIFLEPENENQLYINGLSTSIDYKNQIELVKSIKGLEKSKIVKPGYAIEYDFFFPKNLKKSLESKKIKGLFLAGQINGTTGYEEAAAQGIIAGINSCLFLENKKFWYPNKKNSYIGLMINDITKYNITEPYRIFTNKSENKLKLREDNSKKRMEKVYKNLNFKKKFFFIKNKIFFNYLKKNYIFNNNIILFYKIKKQINIYFKYKNYAKVKKNKKIKKKIFLKNLKISKNLNYFKIKNISKENSEKLNKKKPNNLKELFKLNIEKDQINIILNYIKKN